MKTLCLFAILVFQCIYASETNMEYVSQKGEKFTLEWKEPSELALLDQDQLKALNTRSFHLAYRACGSFAHWTDSEIDAYLTNYFTTAISPRLTDNPALFFVSVLKGDQLAGYALFEKTGPEEIYVAELAIDSQYWRQGIGRYLMDAIVVKEPATKKIWLITEHVNKGAQAFYESLNFTTSTQIHEGYSSDLYRGYERIVSK